MQVAIIGAGLTGLSAAYSLSGRHHVVIYEGRGEAGGCLASYHMPSYTIEEYYHHCFAGDSALFSMLGSLGLGSDLEWRTATTGTVAGGRIIPMSTPFEILRSPLLPVTDIVKLGLLTLRARKYDRDALDTVTARDFILSEVGARLYTSFFEPLLRSKFGPAASSVSAAWLISRIAIRGNRTMQGESLGYLKGGWERLVSGLSSEIIHQGGEVRTGIPVTSISRSGGPWQLNGETYDAVIATLPPPVLATLGIGGLPDIPYQGAACLTLSLARDVTEGIYWLNMNDPAPYGAVIGHTNFIPHDRYGEHLVYLASYFSGEVPPGIEEQMAGDFCRRFQVEEDEVHWQRLATSIYAGPVFKTGFRERITPYRHGNGLYLAGMSSRPNYPERSMEGSIRAGLEVAACVAEDLG